MERCQLQFFFFGSGRQQQFASYPNGRFKKTERRHYLGVKGGSNGRVRPGGEAREKTETQDDSHHQIVCPTRHRPAPGK